MAAPTPAEECNRIIKTLIDSGAFDEIRKKVFEELKTSAELRAYVNEVVDGSKTLSAEAGRGPSKDRKKLLDDLAKELQDKLMGKAAQMLWETLANPDSRVAKDIELKVHEALCRDAEAQQKAQQQQQQQQQQGQQTQQQGGQQGGQQGPGAALQPPTVTPPATGPGGAMRQQLPAATRPAPAPAQGQAQGGRGPHRPQPRTYGVYGGGGGA